MKRTLLEVFAENLRTGREAAHLSQRELGNRAGLTEGYISKLERAVRDPPLSTVERLGAALEITPSTLLQMTDR